MYEKYTEFSEKCSEASEMCHYLEGIVKLCRVMKNLVAAERTGNWRGDLQSAQDLLLVFGDCNSLNYLRYGSLYFNKMRILDTGYEIFTSNLRKVIL